MRPYESSRRDEKSKMSLQQDRSHQEVAELIGVRDFFIGESLASDIRALDSKEEVIKRKEVHKRRIKNIEKYRPLLDHQTSEGTMSSAILWVKDYKLEVMRTRKQITKMNQSQKPSSPKNHSKEQLMFPTFSPSGMRRQEDEGFVYKVALDAEGNKVRTPVLRRQGTNNLMSPRGKQLPESKLPELVASASTRNKIANSQALLNPLGIVRAEVKIGQLGTMLSESIKDAFQMEFLDQPTNPIATSNRSLNQLERVSSTDGSRHEQKPSGLPVFSRQNLDPIEVNKITDSSSILKEDMVAPKSKISQLFSPQNRVQLAFDLKTPQSTRVRYQHSFNSGTDHLSSDTGSQLLLPAISKHNHSRFQQGSLPVEIGLSKLNTPKGYLTSEDTNASSAPQSVISYHTSSILSRCKDALSIGSDKLNIPATTTGNNRMFSKVDKLYKLRNPKSWRKVLSPDVLDDIKIALEERRRLKEIGAIIL